MSRATKYFRFGTVRQEVGAKHVAQGELLEAINVRQTAKAGVYAKRRGFSRSVQTFVGGTFTGPPVSAVHGEYGAALMRDSARQLWARDPSTNEWIYRGHQHNLWPTSETVLSRRYTSPMPFSCIVGANIWVFALASGTYDLTIVDATTGVVVAGPITVTAANIVHASAAYDNTNVWVFWVDNQANGIVRAHKFTVATPSVAPVATTYFTCPAAPTDVSTVKLQQVQARYFSAAGKVFVVACGGSLTGGTRKRAALHSVLDPASGLAVAAGGQTVTMAQAYSGGSGTHTVGALYILDGQDGSDTYWYYTYTGNTDTTYTSYQCALIKVTAANFATCPQTIVDASSTTAQIANTAGVCTGGYQIILQTRWFSGTPFGTAEDTHATKLYHVNGATVGTSTTTGGFCVSWVASGFSLIGSKWYVMTGYDAYALGPTTFGAEATSTQRSYHLHELTVGANAAATYLELEAQFGVGQGPALWHKNTGLNTIPSANPPVTCTPPAHTVGTTIVSACGVRATATGYVDVAVMTTSTTKTFGKDCTFAGLGLTAGNIPMVWSATDNAHEIAPLLAPSRLIISGAPGTDYNIAAVVFAIYDNDGRVWRSAPLVKSQSYAVGDTFTVQNPQIAIGGTRVEIEIYIGAAGVAKLQIILPVTLSGVSPTYTTYTVPAVASMVDGEILYTTGNALSQTWPVASQVVGAWKNRVFLAHDETVWASKEIEEGFGPLFNEVQTFYWSDTNNQITAMAPVDANYFALFTNDNVGVISGPGPDGVGNGNYSIQTLNTRTGVSDGAPARQGYAGCYYQDHGLGRIHVITPALAVAEAAGGAYDYSSYVINSIVWHDDEKQMLFFAAASNAAIVVDYNHPTEAAPFGKTFLWTFPAEITAYGSLIDTTGFMTVDSLGYIHRPAAQWTDTLAAGATSYQMRLTTAELQLGDLQGEINVEMVQALLSVWATTGATITVIPGYAHATLADARKTSKTIVLTATNAGDPTTLMHRPSNCARIQSVRVSIEEAASIANQSFDFEGLAIRYFAPGKLMYPASGKVI